MRWKKKIKTQKEGPETKMKGNKKKKVRKNFKNKKIQSLKAN